MSHAQPTTAAQDPPLKRPCERDLQIYQAVRIGFRKQVAVAQQFGISESRVSQVLRKVTRFMAGLLPGEELSLRLEDAKRAQLIDWETYERRKEDYRKAEMVWEQSLRPLTTTQWTYAGSANDERNLKKTVITQREQRLSLGAVQTMERINDKLERTSKAPTSGRGVGRGDVRGNRTLTTGQGFDRQGSDTPFAKLPLPAGLRKEDEPLWPKLLREEQEEALEQLQRWPGAPLEWLKIKPGSGPHYTYYPWRTEAEHNSALLASMVVSGDYTIEKYLQELELLELSKPFAHPNVLRKDCHGQWRMMHPKQVPLPALTPERAALPEESPERLYWPYKSRAEHYAMQRAEMVLRGHLSREQYDRLNAWASWTMNEPYPDPLANLERNISAETPLAGTKPGPGEAPQEAAPQITGSRFASGDGASKAPTSGRGVEQGIADEPTAGGASDEVRGHSTLTTSQGFDSAGPPERNRFERLLARGRAMSPARRRRFERQANH
jgi:hypothetical protein